MEGFWVNIQLRSLQVDVSKNCSLEPLMFAEGPHYEITFNQNFCSGRSMFVNKYVEDMLWSQARQAEQLAEPPGEVANEAVAGPPELPGRVTNPVEARMGGGGGC